MRMLKLLAVALVLVFAAAACGGSEPTTPATGDDPGVDDTTGTATEAPTADDGTAAPTEDDGDAAASGEPLRIGLMLPTSGVLAANGMGNADGFLFYWDAIADNLAAGRPVEIIREDTEGNPEVALTKARKLVEQDGVDVLTGIVSSAAALAVQEYASSSGVPLVIHQAAASEITASPAAETGTARVIATFRQTMLPFSRWIAESEGHGNVVFLGSDYAAGRDAEQAVREGIEGAGGTIIESTFPPLGTQDFGPFINRIDRSADAVVAFFGGTDALRFLQQYAEFGLAGDMPLYAHWALTVGPLLEEAGDEAIGVTTVQEYLDVLETPANAAFVERWDEVNGTVPNSWNEQGYTAALLIDELVRASGGGAIDLAGGLEGLELESPRGTVSFDENGQIVLPVYASRVEEQDGRKVNALLAELGVVSQSDVAGDG